jgi:tetratricopeptide (TPR) repeat protein
LPIIPQRKIDRINKKVIPHLRRAIELYQREKLQKSEQELTIAISNYKKEKTFVLEISQDFAALHNNLGTMYLLRKNYSKAFRLFSKALQGKRECRPTDIESIRKTVENMINAGLLICKFDELLNVMKELITTYSNEANFKNYLIGCITKIERVQKNEPELSVAGMHITSFNFITPIDDLVHFPEAFEDIETHLESQLILIDHKTLECSFKLTIPDSKTKPVVPFVTDYWKKLRPKGLESKIENAVPLLVLLLSENGHIPLNSVKVKDKLGRLVKFDFKIVFTEFYIPDSYPRFGYSFGDIAEIPNCKSFKYFRGKAGILEWELISGEEYQIQLSIKNYEQLPSSDELFTMRLGILLPFKRVKYNTSHFKHTSKISIDKVLLKRIEYFNDRDRPRSFSFRSEPSSISENQFANDFLPMADSGKQTYDITPPRPCKNDDDYSVFGIYLRFKVGSEKMSIATTEWEQPIPTALSHLLLDTRYSFPPLCQYDIVNNSKNEVILNLKTEIEEFTNIQEENTVILPYSTVRVNHTPLFRQSIVDLSETCDANLLLSAIVGNEPILKKTLRISLLAFDTMIFEILNPLSRQIFDLHDFLAIWVTPHDREVEKLVSIAKEYHPQRVLQGYPTGISDDEIRRSTNLQCEAAFMALKEIGISYVDASLSFGWLDPFAFQRVKLPSTTIKTKSANCIDGTILFASLLEHIGLQPIIVLMPKHAIIGWKPTPNSNIFELLETTQISSADFATAVKSGRESLKMGLDNARHILNNPTLTLDGAVNSKIIRLIDVVSMREKKIFPQSQTMYSTNRNL